MQFNHMQKPDCNHSLFSIKTDNSPKNVIQIILEIDLLSDKQFEFSGI